MNSAQSVASGFLYCLRAFLFLSASNLVFQNYSTASKAIACRITVDHGPDSLYAVCLVSSVHRKDVARFASRLQSRDHMRTYSLCLLLRAFNYEKRFLLRH